jgi:hypothetical protein
MELDHMLLADEVVQRADGKIDIVGAGWDTIVAEELPVRHPQITIVLRLLLAKHEAEHEHQIELVLMGEDGEVARLTGTVPPAPADLLKTWPYGEKYGVATVINLQRIEFEAYGRYHFASLWDGTELREPLVFKVIPPSPSVEHLTPGSEEE